MVASRENFPLLAELLAEQQRLDTPVAKFSGAHESGSISQLASLRAQLIPLSAPGPGEQYAFEVELDSCTGCKACVSACHSLNGLDDTETWRDVGMIVGGAERQPFQQTVTTACHHCADPACLNGCPVLAYEKDPLTGIVRHLDDQCIGCQYCILKCPYDVPKYNARLGIVRKCDLCHSRLAASEAPACAQACPTQAIRIVTVKMEIEVKTRPLVAPLVRADVSGRLGAPSGPAQPQTEFLTAAPDPAYTRPTTRYRSRRPQPENLRATDAAVLRPQPPHWPLAVMLTLLPLAVGCGVVVALAGSSGSRPPGSFTYYVKLSGWVAGTAGLGASMGHLGRPGRAWRIFLGWRTSWLSREAMVFSAWFGAAAGALKYPALNAVACALGAAGLFCSAMIYIDTRRVFWRATQTLPKFFGSAVALGAAAALAFGISPAMSAGVLGMATLAKLAIEVRPLRAANAEDEEDVLSVFSAVIDRRHRAEINTARLLTTGRLRGIFGSRVAVALIANGLAPAMIVAGMLPAGAAWAVLAAVFAGELTERHLFFRAVDAPKMPGMPG